jgi:hypothetical protein
MGHAATERGSTERWNFTQGDAERVDKGAPLVSRHVGPGPKQDDVGDHLSLRRRGDRGLPEPGRRGGRAGRLNRLASASVLGLAIFRGEPAGGTGTGVLSFSPTDSGRCLRAKRADRLARLRFRFASLNSCR